MNSFIQLISDLINSQTGSLAYHLVLVFSIGGALHICFNFWDKDRSEWKRMVVGLSAMMGIQLVLFILAVSAWQGFFNIQNWLASGIWIASLINLVIIIWMWAVPVPSKILDTAALALIFFALTLGVLWAALHSTGDNIVLLDSFRFDQIINIFAIVLIVAGSILLLQKRTSGWEYGIAMLSILFFGYLAQVFLSTVATNGLSTYVRLAELAAYPLLIALPQRYLQAADLGKKEIVTADPVFLSRLYMNMTEEPNAYLSGRLLVEEMVNQFNASLCILVELRETDSLMVRNVFDTRKGNLEIPTSLDPGLSPLLLKSLQSYKALRLSSSSSVTEIALITQELGVESMGHAMVVPLRNFGYPVMGIILVRSSKYARWDSAEVDAVRMMAAPLVHFLHLTDHMAFIQGQLEVAEKEIHDLQSKTQGNLQGSGLLHEEIQNLRLENQEKQSQLQTLADMVTLQQETLASANQKINALSIEVSRQKFGLDADVWKELTFQLDELRQPVASIQENADYLLGQAMGTRGELQKKLVDRIQLSSERAVHILDDILDSIHELKTLSTNQEPDVDLNGVVDAAINDALVSIKNKQIVLRMDIPENIPGLVTDEHLLCDVLTQLLMFAGDVSPQFGEIVFRAQVEEDQGRVDYIIFQITDSGDGHSMPDLENIFNPQDLTEVGSHIDQEHPVFDLSHISGMVEKLRGKIWIENEPGQGSTVSLLLPVSPLTTNEGWNEGMV